MKILIIRLSSIGDILLSTPFIRQVRQTLPAAEIDYLIKEEYLELIKDNPQIDNLIVFRKSGTFKELRQLKSLIRTNNYNYIFDLHNNLRSNYIRRGIKTDFTKSIKKDKIKQLLLVYLKQNKYSKIIPITLRYLKVGKSFGICDDGQGLELFWNNDTEKTVSDKLNKINIDRNKYISIAPGAMHFTKRWPVEKYANLIDLIREKYKFQIYILGGPGDSEFGKILSLKESVFDFTGELSLQESGVVLSKSIALISNDSGLMHMATSVKTPVVAIFGSSVKEFGFAPYGDKSIVIENNNLKCRPCSHIGRNNCPKKHFLCMRDIIPDKVMEKLDIILKV